MPEFQRNVLEALRQPVETGRVSVARVNAHVTYPARVQLVDGQRLEDVAAPDEAGRRLLMEATERMRLTARGYHRVLRVSRTLADLDGADGVTRIHVAEALSYRRIQPGRGAALVKPISN